MFNTKNQNTKLRKFEISIFSPSVIPEQNLKLFSVQYNLSLLENIKNRYFRALIGCLPDQFKIA